MNFTLRTPLGDLDLLGEIAGGGRYEPRAVEIAIFGTRRNCIDLTTLILTKRAAGRPQDFEAMAESEALLEEVRRKKECCFVGRNL